MHSGVWLFCFSKSTNSSLMFDENKKAAHWTSIRRHEQLMPQKSFWLWTVLLFLLSPRSLLVSDLFVSPLLISWGIIVILPQFFVLPQQRCGLWRLLILTVNNTQKHRCSHTNIDQSDWAIFHHANSRWGDSCHVCMWTICLPAQ